MQTILYDIGLVLGILISVATVFKLFIFNPLNKLISSTVAPLKESIEGLQRSVDRLSEISEIKHQALEDRLNQHEEQLARHDEQIHTLFNEQR